jgi:ribosomal protein S18 acetylase RimI-like enzyme
MTIRTTRAEDARQLRELRLEALRSHPIAFTADLSESEAFDDQHWVERAVAGAGDGREAVYVADASGGRLVGMSGIYTPPNRPKLAHSGTIWGVYVRPEARGSGVGKALVNACVEWARAKGLVIVKLSATTEPPTAQRCYERCGFEPYGVEPLAVQVDGRFYDEVLMARRLQKK